MRIHSLLEELRAHLCLLNLLLNVLLATLFGVSIDFIDKLLVAGENICGLHGTSSLWAEEALDHHALLDAEG